MCVYRLKIKSSSENTFLTQNLKVKVNCPWYSILPKSQKGDFCDFDDPIKLSRNCLFDQFLNEGGDMGQNSLYVEKLVKLLFYRKFYGVLEIVILAF